MGGGGGNSSAADKSNAIAEQQLAIEKKQEQQKMAQLSQQEFGIVKAQGNMNWNAQAPHGIEPGAA
jgi:hypothetical protein